MILRVPGLALALLLALASGGAGAADAPPLMPIVERHAQWLAAVTSDAEALALFSSKLAPALGLNASSVPDHQQAAGQLVAELAAWRLAVAVRTAADAGDPASLPPLFQSIAAQQAWLLANERFPALRQVISFNESHTADDPGRLPRLAGLALRAEAEAERNARLHWERLRAWHEQQQAQQSAMRLCGTWQWTIHNHKNHQEHKTAVVLLPPGAQAPPNVPQPAKMVVLGDTVYLRWEFPRGYQEDSLLFAQKEGRLEGTFTNTAGDWGAITAKLISPCTQP